MMIPTVPEYKGMLGKAVESIDIAKLESMADSIIEASGKGNTVYVFGNGDSATNATHFACDLSKGTITEGKPRLRVLSLNENVPLMSAWSNDTSYDEVFREQLRNLLNEGDVVIGISTSGNSPNVVKAIEYAKTKGAKTFVLCAFQGGKLSPLADVSLVADTDNVEVAEDVHFIIGHLIKIIILRRLGGQ